MDFELSRTQTLPHPLADVFAFFADARNLGELTPEWLDFRITTPKPIHMAPGTHIDYRIKLRGIPMKWQSEITVWEPPHRFVDEQRVGPYRRWIHEHTFDALGESETRVTDHVRYAVPGGRLVHGLFIRRDLERIFDYRAEALERVFGEAAVR